MKMWSDRGAVSIQISLFIALWGILWLFLLWLYSGNDAIIILMFSVFSISVCVFPLALKNVYDVFEPISFVVLSLVLSDVLFGIYMVLDWNTSDFYRPMHVELHELIQSGIVILGGIICLMVGYQHRYAIRVRHLRKILQKSTWSSLRIFVVCLVLLGIYMICLRIYTRTMDINMFDVGSLFKKRFLMIEGETGYTSLNFLRWPISILNLGVYLLWIHVLQKKATIKALLLLGIMGLLSLLFPIINSSRTDLMMIIIAVIAIYHYAKAPMTIKRLMVFTLLGLAILLVMQIMRRPFSSSEELFERFTSDRVFELAGKLSQQEKMALLIRNIPELIDYQNGKSFFLWILAPIPRVLWPEKPALRLGGTEIMWHIFGFSGRIGGIPPGLAGELYLNFGYVGIFVGMFLIGWCLKTVYNTFRPYLAEKNGNAIVLYLCIIFPLSSMTEVSKIILDIGKNLLPLLILLYYVSRKEPASVSSQALRSRSKQPISSQQYRAITR